MCEDNNDDSITDDDVIVDKVNNENTVRREIHEDSGYRWFSISKAIIIIIIIIMLLSGSKVCIIPTYTRARARTNTRTMAYYNILVKTTKI